MKNYFVFTIFIMTALTGCGSDDEKSPEASAASRLEGTWTVNGGQVLIDGIDHTADYAAFSISFTEAKDGSFIYTIQNGGHAFHDITMDTWNFTDNSFTKIIRGKDEVEMAFALDDDLLTLQFTIADPIEEGRVEGLFGEFVMKLKKR
jgi:hypothetical protein